MNQRHNGGPLRMSVFHGKRNREENQVWPFKDIPGEVFAILFDRNLLGKFKTSVLN